MRPISVHLSLFALAACSILSLPQDARAAPGQTLSVDAANPGTGVYAGPTYTVPSSGDAYAQIYDGFTGAGTINQLSGTLTLGNSLILGQQSGGSGVYNFNGGTLVTPGISQGSGSGVFNFNGGKLQASVSSTAFLQGLTAANIQAGGFSIDTRNFNDTISQPLLHDPALGATPDGGLTVLSSSGTLTLTGVNTYTGGTIFAGGGVNVGSAGALGSVGTLYLGGVLQYSAANQTDYSARFSTAFGANISIDTNGQNIIFATALTSNGGSLTKLGAGTLTLTATNTYTNSTMVNGGTLTVQNDAAAARGHVGVGINNLIINNGGTLLLSGSAAVVDRLNNTSPVYISGGGKFATGGLSEGARPTAPGVGGAAGLSFLNLSYTDPASPAIIDFGMAGLGSALVFSSLDATSKGIYASIINWTGAAGADNNAATNDRLLFVQDPGYSVADLAHWQFSNDAGVNFAAGGMEIAYNGYFEIVPIPEPSAARLLGAALLFGSAGGAALSRQRRGRTS